MNKIKIYIEKNSKNVDAQFIDLLKEFIPFTSKILRIETPFTLHLVDSKVPQLRTTGVYENTEKEIWVRLRSMICDVFRSIAHEMTHHKQNELGLLNEYSGKDDSTEEGQANRVAGIVIRKFGRLHPEIYQ